ncbi:MAG: FAD-dependent oxidoreductase, partial [Candidatus Thiodiazotropha sp. 6PLUC5]
MTTDHEHDVLIVGSGAAGLSLALHLDENLKIAVISKKELEETNTYYAQGGISVVLDEEDSIASHVKDTLDAGAGLCDEKTVQLVVEKGPSNIDWLLKGGVNFTRDDNSATSGGYHLTQEGGHSHRRVIHAADATGREVETTLQSQVKARSNIEIFEHHIAIDLITSEKSGEIKQQKHCYGAYVLDHESNHVQTFRARFVVLATGGASKVYLYT